MSLDKDFVHFYKLFNSRSNKWRLIWKPINDQGFAYIQCTCLPCIFINYLSLKQNHTFYLISSIYKIVRNSDYFRAYLTFRF